MVFIGLLLTIQQKNYQRTTFINSANSISGGTYSTINNIQDYFHLKYVNDELQLENAQLRAQILTSLKKVNGDYYQVDDTLYQQKYVYRLAKVISNSYTRPNNFVTINMGSNDGVIEEMGVISPSGIVGIVGSVTNNFSTVISFLHPKTVISCRLKTSGVSGLLKWTGKSIGQAEIKDIPITTRITEGDSILTSGYSSVFPAGIYLGRIKSFEKDLESQTQKIIVDLKLDYAALDKVYVVENLFKKELEELKQKETDLNE